MKKKELIVKDKDVLEVACETAEFSLEASSFVFRKATPDEMVETWGYKGEELSPTARFFIECIDKKICDFYALDCQGKIIGELYVFWKLEDTDFADGKNTAYLCAFRIKEEYRHQGLGKMLIKEVMKKVKAQGFRAVTIGVDETEEDNIRLYKSLGFNEKIKDCFEDPCDVDINMKPKECNCFWLLKKVLGEEI